MGKQWASNKTSSGEFTLVMHLVIDFQLNTGPECQASYQSTIISGYYCQSNKKKNTEGLKLTEEQTEKLIDLYHEF